MWKRVGEQARAAWNARHRAVHGSQAVHESRGSTLRSSLSWSTCNCSSRRAAFFLFNRSFSVSTISSSLITCLSTLCHAAYSISIAHSVGWQSRKECGALVGGSVRYVDECECAAARCSVQPSSKSTSSAVQSNTAGDSAVAGVAHYGARARKGRCGR